MLKQTDVKQVFTDLQKLGLHCRFGYAGSYARGQEKESSDFDIVVEGQDILSSDDYFKIYHTIKKILPN